MLTPRPYQLDAKRAVFAALAQHRSTLVVMATGLGKTVLFSHVAAEWPAGERVLVMAHRDELIQQAAEKLEQITGTRPGIEMGSERLDRVDRCRVVVTSVQTMCRPTRHGKFDPDQFGLVIVDEGHHAVSATYKKVIGHFHKAKVLYVTATPRRADGLAMGNVCDCVAYEYGIEQASKDGWLVPVRQRVVMVESIDLSVIDTTTDASTGERDFNKGQLSEMLTADKPLYAVAKPTVEVAGDQSCLVFCVSVEHARKMADVLNGIKRGSADYVCGETPRDQRRRTIEQFRGGKLQFLCNMGVLLEGFDAPITSMISMARPTKSLSLYIQVIGRMLRPLPGLIDGVDSADGRCQAIATSRKPCGLILDFAGNAGKHHVVSAEDVLGGRYGEPIREYARQTAKDESHQMLVDDALDRAEAELALLEEERQRAEARARIAARAEYRTQDVSIYRGHAVQAGGVYRVPADDEKATPKQIWKLMSLGVSREKAEGYTKRQASAVIGRLLERAG